MDQHNFYKFANKKKDFLKEFNTSILCLKTLRLKKVLKISIKIKLIAKLDTQTNLKQL